MHEFGQSQCSALRYLALRDKSDCPYTDLYEWPNLPDLFLEGVASVIYFTGDDVISVTRLLPVLNLKSRQDCGIDLFKVKRRKLKFANFFTIFSQI